MNKNVITRPKIAKALPIINYLYCKRIPKVKIPPIIILEYTASLSILLFYRQLKSISKYVNITLKTITL